MDALTSGSLKLVRFSLERREIVNWEPLRRMGWALSTVAPLTRSPLYEQTVAAIPIRRVLCLDAVAPRVSRYLGRLDDGLGRRFFGLSRCVSPDDLCSVMETYAPHASQAIELRENKGCRAVIVSCHENVPFLYESSTRDARAKARVRASADHFIAITPFAADALITEGVDANRISMIPLGVDLKLYRPRSGSDRTRHTWRVEQGQVVILYAGRLIPEKGISELLRAFAILHAMAPEVVLVIQGRGGDRERLERIARALRVEDAVRFADWTRMDELPSAYEAADIVAVPSLSAPHWQEQLGFALIEAMACGRPIVSTWSGSIPWVVGDSAILTTPYDVQGLADALLRLSRDSTLRSDLGASGRSRAAATFSTEGVANALHHVLSAFA